MALMQFGRVALATKRYWASSKKPSSVLGVCEEGKRKGERKGRVRGKREGKLSPRAKG
jgi:hypothetical protein